MVEIAAGVQRSIQFCHLPDPLRRDRGGSPNSGRERDSLGAAEISLIANLNSLQGHKKFPAPMRRELASKHLMRRLFLLPLTRRRASR